MALIGAVMGTGASAVHARAIVGDVEDTITATGTVIGDAYDLSKPVSFVTTTASSTGVQLPASQKGDSYFVSNLGANTLKVYPAGSAATINGGSAGAAVSITTLKGGVFVCNSADGLSFSAVLGA